MHESISLIGHRGRLSLLIADYLEQANLDTSDMRCIAEDIVNLIES